MFLRPPRALLAREPNQVYDLIPALDGARGFAILLVLLDHASDAGLTVFPGADFSGAGKYGVYLFFTLSAFLLTYPFMLRPAADILRGAVWQNYWMRRSLRIFPLYIVVLLVHAWRRGDFGVEECIEHVLLQEGDGHFWTIPVEFKYYLVLPFFLFVVSYLWRVHGWRWGLAGLAVFHWILLHKIIFPAEIVWSNEKEIWLGNHIYLFLFGSAAGVVHAGMIRQNLRWKWVRPMFELSGWVALGSAVLLIPGIYAGFLGPLPAGESEPFDMSEVCAVLWPTFLLGMIHGTGLLRRLFESAALRLAGLVSYSAYLWHRMILAELDDTEWLQGWPGLALFLVLVAAISTVSYLLIERPLLRIRLTRRRVPTPNAVTEA